jgi:hypothetical protein
MNNVLEKTTSIAFLKTMVVGLSVEEKKELLKTLMDGELLFIQHQGIAAYLEALQSNSIGGTYIAIKDGKPTEVTATLLSLDFEGEFARLDSNGQTFRIGFEDLAQNFATHLEIPEEVRGDVNGTLDILVCEHMYRGALIGKYLTEELGLDRDVGFGGCGECSGCAENLGEAGVIPEDPTVDSINDLAGEVLQGIADKLGVGVENVNVLSLDDLLGDKVQKDDSQQVVRKESAKESVDRLFEALGLVRR